MNKRVKTVTLIVVTLLGLTVAAFAYHIVTGGGNAGAPLGRTVSGY